MFPIKNYFINLKIKLNGVVFTAENTLCGNTCIDCSFWKGTISLAQVSDTKIGPLSVINSRTHVIRSVWYIEPSERNLSVKFSFQSAILRVQRVGHRYFSNFLDNYANSSLLFFIGAVGPQVVDRETRLSYSYSDVVGGSRSLHHCNNGDV